MEDLGRTRWVSGVLLWGRADEARFGGVRVSVSRYAHLEMSEAEGHGDRTVRPCGGCTQISLHMTGFSSFCTISHANAWELHPRAELN